jgi:hypothetical protein
MSALYAMSSLPHHHATSAADVTLPHVTLPVVTRVTLGLAQLHAKSAKSA